MLEFTMLPKCCLYGRPNPALHKCRYTLCHLAPRWRQPHDAFAPAPCASSQYALCKVACGPLRKRTQGPAWPHMYTARMPPAALHTHVTRAPSLLRQPMRTQQNRSASLLVGQAAHSREGLAHGSQVAAHSWPAALALATLNSCAAASTGSGTCGQHTRAQERLSAGAIRVWHVHGVGRTAAQRLSRTRRSCQECPRSARAPSRDAVCRHAGLQAIQQLRPLRRAWCRARILRRSRGPRVE